MDWLSQSSCLFAGLQISPVGVGAWSWGDRTGALFAARASLSSFKVSSPNPCLLSGYWGYGSEYQKEDNLDAYKAVVGNGISFIDTSEVCYAYCFASQLFHVGLSGCSTTPCDIYHNNRHHD